jgi:hypothetical protein
VLKFEKQELWLGGVKVVTATGLMAGFIWLFAHIEIWFLLPLAFFIYAIALMIVRVFSRDDWLLATRFLK